MLTITGIDLKGLDDYSQSAYEAFITKRTKSYTDDLVSCWKNSDNLPVCQRTSEAAIKKQRWAGPVARMQRAADRLINKLPLYKSLKAYNPTTRVLEDLTLRDPVTGGTFTGWVLTNPISQGSGYDGRVGADTAGWVNLSLVLATLLAEVPADIVPALAAPNPPVLVRFADPIATFLDAVVADFDFLLEAYKNAPKVSPILAPEVIVLINNVIVEHKRKTTVGGVLVAGGASMAGIAIVGIAKGAGAAGLMGVLGDIFGFGRIKRTSRRRNY